MSDPHASDVDAALTAFGKQRRAAAQRIAHGTLNANFVVACDDGDYVLRAMRSEQSVERVRAEHEAIAWAHARGIPVARPLHAAVRAALRNDALPSTCVRLLDGSLWALFPKIEGAPPPRGNAQPRQVEALGDMHGRIHAAFARHPQSVHARFTMQWSRAHSLASLRAVEQAARAAGEAHGVLDGILLQRRLLESEPLVEPAAFTTLPCQLLHGDFHDEQVLMDSDDRIVAVLDWELVQGSARVWELIRALAFMGLLEHEHLTRYLRAYARHVQLSRDECERGLALWWQSRLGGTWVWTAALLEKNDRVRTFFAPTIETLHKLAQPGWRATAETRFMAAAAPAG